MKELYEQLFQEYLSKKERDAIPDEDFAGPHRSFPVRNQDDVDNDARLLGHAKPEDQPEIKRNIIRLAKKKGLTLPQSWQDELEKKETTESAAQRPAKKIGSLKICWLEYNARSLNGRIYPKATCDRIFQSGLRKLSDPNGLPITTFVSHETANSNVNTELAGRVSRLWQEGNKFWAMIDLADTRAGHDMLALAEGDYLKSGSMRVLGVELMHDRNYDVPLVVCSEGIEPDLAGIDLTTRPGLADSARITQVLYESADQQAYIEILNIDTFVETKEEVPMASLPIYLQVALGILQESTAREAHIRVHDHLAGVLDEALGKPMHGAESARLKALVEGQFEEAIAKKHMARLVAAHDESAHQLGMKCEGVYKEDVNPDDSMDGTGDTDNDGDDPAHGYDPDNDGESRQKETPLTEQEMIEALKAKGFIVETPKTAEQQKIEEQAAKIAALEAKFAQLAESQQTPPARQTTVESQFAEQNHLQPEKIYESGDYLKGDLHPRNWRALANKQVPWPQDLDPALVLSELTPFLEYQFLNMQEAAAGRSLRDQISLGLID